MIYNQTMKLSAKREAAYEDGRLYSCNRGEFCFAVAVVSLCFQSLLVAVYRLCGTEPASIRFYEMVSHGSNTRETGYRTTELMSGSREIQDDTYW